MRFITAYFALLIVGLKAGFDSPTFFGVAALLFALDKINDTIAAKRR